MYNKGIVLEVKEDCCLVMDDSGRICRIKRKGEMREGQKIYFLEEDLYEEEKRGEAVLVALPFGSKKRVGKVKKTTLQKFTAIAAALLLCIGVIAMPQFARETYATVSVDGPESIQLELNRKGEILRVSSYGNSLSKEEKSLYQGKSLEEFWKIFSERNKDGQQVVLISYAAVKGGAETEQKVRTELLKNTKKINSVYLKGTKTDVEAARKADKSLGAYIFGRFEDKEDFEDFLEDSSRENILQFIKENADRISPEKAQRILEEKGRIDEEEIREDAEEIYDDEDESDTDEQDREDGDDDEDDDDE